MTYAGASIDIIIAKACADELLHKEGFFIGAAARGNAAKGIAAIFRANPFQFGCGVGKCFVPFDLTPRIADRCADHWLQYAFLMLGIAPRKATLYATVAAIGLTVFVGDHPHQLLAAHFCAEGAADTAIGAGRNNAAFGCADLYNLFFYKGCCWAGLHTRTARHAFGTHKIVTGKASRYF